MTQNIMLKSECQLGIKLLVYTNHPKSTAYYITIPFAYPEPNATMDKDVHLY